MKKRLKFLKKLEFQKDIDHKEDKQINNLIKLDK